MNIGMSEEFHLQWIGRGFKMVAPESLGKSTPFFNFIKPVQSFLSLPIINIYIKNLCHEIQFANEVLPVTHCLSSLNDIIGQTVEKVFTKETITHLHTFDKITQKTQQMGCREYPVYLKNGLISFAIDYKFPLYNLTNVLVGILGMSLVSGDTSITPLSAAIQLFAEFGMFDLINKKTNFDFAERKIGNVYFSQREWDCLPFLARGITAKKIAQSLGISSRTVEQHTESIKIKLNVYSKNDLIYTLSEKCHFL